ncbi:hypothetical protein D7Y13_28600 [Corallococcus praedator]|uniref:Uncharacterized protein n=2 Tax=Myxococcaceae TaxID=31 RepID=A0ABX9QAL8_9BACT|nr:MULTISPECIES: hypothetical protein [Corallococcus]MCY1046496.1 hypothetical protein [Corallococcus sp. bb12-1]RKH15908.1 hypothetical protein D7X74_17080 [Corallococcus sp. CA047B]RKH24427.1 hypothetical protein D7X75_31960 [Corallococcus sp. CA031C]RKH98486.1 hypothetical protein D7Y13_28600 [Corallococcus praedator]
MENMTMPQSETPVSRDNEGWLVRVKVAGRIQEVRCATENQARYFAAVLSFNNAGRPNRLRN